MFKNKNFGFFHLLHSAAQHSQNEYDILIRGKNEFCNLQILALGLSTWTTLAQTLLIKFVGTCHSRPLGI